MDLLPGCASYIRLRLLSTFEAGDHDVALCEVEGTGVWEGELQSVVSLQGDSQPLDSPFVLYTGQLRQEGII
jgi:flavin reductase (DIM6/NTAB) family NADH-FMN oxidoreductase RutF